jgi:hypothetical protein
MSRAKCRRDAAQRHEERGQQQELRHRHNIRLAGDGELTPWQQAEAKRAGRRLRTCGQCRIPFGEDKEGQLRCPQCHGTVTLKAAWEKRKAA